MQNSLKKLHFNFQDTPPHLLSLSKMQSRFYVNIHPKGEYKWTNHLCAQVFKLAALMSAIIMSILLLLPFPLVAVVRGSR